MKSLRIAILAQLNSPTITEQLAPELRRRGHVADVLDVSKVSTQDIQNDELIQSLSSYDLVYYRSGLDAGDKSVRIVRLEAFLRDTSVQTVNLRYTEHPLAHTKSYEIQKAQEVGLLTPKTVYPGATDFTSISESLGIPFITKTDMGTNGTGVRMIESEQDLLDMQNTYPGSKLVHQEFIAHEFEYRVHVMEGEMVCIWKKASPEGDFRTNEAQGGEMLAADEKYAVNLTKLAKLAHKAMEFEIFVADFMLEKNTDEFYFTEVNLNPGWGQTDQDAAGVDVISLTADYFEKKCI
jgi:glutathione synthase/RimK-type ligase-like ATP-grasp enzyme